MGTYQRLYHQFKDIKENEYLLEIYKTGYSSSYNIKYQESESITLEHGGDAKDQWDFTYVLGQELRCVLYIPRDDVSVIDDILESEYKDWNVKLTKGATILFQGFLKPENVYKRFEIKPPYIEFELSATDGLADLKDVDFNQPGDSDDIATTTISLLQAVKYALTQVGIPLPFCIQINTYESTYMNFDDCPLTSIFCNTKRFYSKDDTKYKPIKCWNALEIVLKIFNAKLFQYDGHYYIVNFHEIISNGYFYDWGLSLIEKTSTGTKIDISSYLYTPYVEQQKIQPLKSVLLTIENSDPGQELQDFTDYENVWEFDVRNGNASNLHHGINTAGNLVLNMSAYGEPYMRLKSDMNIVQKYPDYDEYLRVSFKYRMIYYNKNKAGMNYTSPKIAVERGDVWTKYSKANAPTKSWQEYDSFADSKFIISQDGTYNIEINIDSRYGKRQFDEFSLEIADLNITQYVPAINKQYNPTQVNADVTYKQINVKGYENLELDAKLFDSLITSEDAALLISDGANLVCTTLWYIYYGTTAMKIVDACSRYILLNRSRYKNFLKCTIIDRDYLITMNCILIIQSRYYVFNSYARNFQLGEIEAELVELITTDVEGSVVEDDIDDYPTIEDDTLKSARIPTNTGTEDDVEVVDLETHGFVVGDVIRIEDGDSAEADIKYYLAQADSIAHATAIGVVSEIIDEDTFKYISFGLLPIEVFDVIPGLYYYLSPTNPGKMVTSPTYEEYEIEQAIGFGTDKGLYVEIDARNLNFKSIIEKSVPPSGVPIYMHVENSDVTDSDSFEDSSGATDIGDYDQALLLPPNDQEYFYLVYCDYYDGEILMKAFITDVGMPNTTMIPAGGWFFETYIWSSSAEAAALMVRLKVYVYKRAVDGTETELFNFEQKILTAGSTSLLDKCVANEAFILDIDDRLVFKYYAYTDSLSGTIAISLHVEGEVNCTNVKMPVFASLFGYGEETEVITDMSVQGVGTDSDPITLVNDEETPGANKYYGTDDEENKGYHDLPENTDNYVDGIDIDAVAEASNDVLPEVTNENCMVELTLTRTGTLPDLKVRFGSMSALKFWTGSQAEYDALDSDEVDDNTLYFITE